MGDHEARDEPLVDDVETVPDVSNLVEAKVAVSSLVALGAAVGIAELNLVLANSSMLGDLPPWLQFVALAAIPPVLTFLTGYLTPSNRVP